MNAYDKQNGTHGTESDDDFQGFKQAEDAEKFFDQERIKVEDQIKNQRIVFSLLGNVNAGKSSTINALTGLDLASINPIPGHTKDVALYRMPRFPQVLVADTPGLEDVNAEVSARARDFVETDSDIILFFINATQGVTASELKSLQDSVVKEIAEAIEFANASAYPELSSAVKDIYYDIVEEVRSR